MAVSSGLEVLRDELQDLVEVFLGEDVAFLREDRAAPLRLRRQQVGDLVSVSEAYHRDGHQVLHEGPRLLPGDPREQVRVLEDVGLLGRQLPARSLLLFEHLLDLREGKVVLFHLLPPLRLPEVLRERDGLLDLPAEAHVEHVRAAAALHDLPVQAVEPVVGLPLVLAGIDEDDGALPDGVGTQCPGHGGEPALAGSSAELLPGPLHDALRGLHHRSSSVCTSSTSSARTESGTPRRPARLSVVRPPSPWTSSLMYVPASAVTSSVNPSGAVAVRRAVRTCRRRTASARRCDTLAGVRCSMGAAAKAASAS